MLRFDLGKVFVTNVGSALMKADNRKLFVLPQTLSISNQGNSASWPVLPWCTSDSFGQDISYGVTPGLKPPKQILLPYAKQCSTYPDAAPMWAWDRSFAWNYQAIYINTTLMWDNIDRLEETLSGAGTKKPLARVNLTFLSIMKHQHVRTFFNSKVRFLILICVYFD